MRRWTRRAMRHTTAAMATNTATARTMRRTPTGVVRSPYSNMYAASRAMPSYEIRNHETSYFGKASARKLLASGQ